MYHPQEALFGAQEDYTLHSHLYFRDDGYVDLITSVTPKHKVEVLERATYAGLTLYEASDVLMAQAELLAAATRRSA